MGYEHNLFISYAHIDNQPLTPGEQGWVTRFHATLQAILSMRIGGEAKIWRDNKLDGSDIFSDQIVARFKRSAILISILTPRYLKSEWCTREAREFCQNASQNGGLVIDNKSRLIKVIKTPFDARDAETLPVPMKHSLGYEFFEYRNGVPFELDPEYGPKYAEAYKQQVATLAFSLAQLINALNDAPKPGNEPGKSTLYLAECSYDRRQSRQLIESELKRLGYTVLPDKQLPAEEAEYVAAVETMLAQCALSIHLVGESYGAVPDGLSGKSIIVHQNELAVARCRNGGLKRLIWLPEGTRSSQGPQQEFIEGLHRDPSVQFGADLITGDIEQLKAAIHSTLKILEQPEQSERDTTGEEADTAESAKLIYLICDAKDRKDTVPVRKFLKQQGFKVELPAFEGDASEVRKANQQLLATCDSILLFYGAGDEAWKRTIDNELKKMPGYRGGKHLSARFTYLAEPRTDDKDDLLEMDEPGLINGLGGFSEEIMAAFISAANKPKVKP